MINIISISAPSGSGKTTLCKALQKAHPEVKWSVSCTTRQPRPFEVDGVDYTFVSLELFETKIANHEFAEYENVHGEYYGTLKSSLESVVGSESFLLLELDVKGSMKIKEQYPNNAYLIFILPPSMDHLRERLRKRGSDSEERIEKRLQRFEEELGYKDKFDYILINENVEEATQELLEVVNQLNEGVIHGT